MSDVEKYLHVLNEEYRLVTEVIDNATTRLDFIGGFVFGFTTYDSEMCKLLAQKALDVSHAISSRTTFKFIEDAENYRWYLIMMNMPFFKSKTNWGTSIRGAFWDTSVVSFKLPSCTGRDIQIPTSEFATFIEALQKCATEKDTP